jgi:hypothetical protein
MTEDHGAARAATLIVQTMLARAIDVAAEVGPASGVVVSVGERADHL